MAKDSDGDYYYEAGTVNEQFDDIALVEEDGGELGVETPNGVSRVGGLGNVLGGVRDIGDVPGTDELDEGETALYTRTVSGTNTDGVSLFAAHYETGGSIVETEVAVLIATT